MLRKLLSWLLPQICVRCQQPGHFLCEHCFEGISFCDAMPAPGKHSALSSITTVSEYSAPISDLIHTCKYQGIKAIGYYLGQLAYFFVALPSVELITAVPADPIRRRQRGFNQTELIASELARLYHRPFQMVLQKTHHTSSQVQAGSKEARLQNLKGLFAYCGRDSPAHKSVLLVDDVFTTGATLEECAHVLRAAGYKEIHGLTIAVKR